MGRALARVALLALIVFVGAVGPAAAQNRPKPGSPAFQPAPFALPSTSSAAFGARSLGMGRAFVALADDATAAANNPAGLSFLRRPQVSLHGRLGTDERDSLLVGGAWATATVNEMRARASVDPTFALPAPLPDIASDPRLSLEGDTLRPAFAAGVWPLERVTLSAFVEQSRQLEGGGSLELFEPFFADRFDASSQLELSLWGVGVAAATTIGDRWRVGAALRGSSYELSALDRYRVDDWTDFEFASDPPSFTHTDVYLQSTLVDDEDSLIALTVGAVYEPREDLSVGAVFRQGGRVSFATAVETVRCTDIPGQGSCVLSDPTTWTVTPGAGRVAASIPDTLSVGVAWWADDPLLLAADLTFESYDDVMPTVAGGVGDRFATMLDAPGSELRLHLGAEYELGVGRRSAPVFVRGGLFTDPDRDGTRAIGSDRVYATLGAGIVWHRWQLDGAVQLGDGVARALLSLEYSFR